MSEAGPRQLDGAAAFAEAAVGIAGRARREIALLSFELPAALYGTSDFREAVERMILDAGRHARVRILVQEPAAAAGGHRLVTLGQELSSFVDFRRPADEHRDWRSECLIADDRHLLHRQTPEAPTATYQADDPPAALAARRRFDEVWEKATPPPELRRLYLG